MPVPTEITLHQKSKLLEIAFDDASRYRFPFEFLRVFIGAGLIICFAVGYT